MEAEKLAHEVIAKLRHAGHQAYLVGGCVRDLLLGGKPKDFDVATDARPDRIMSLFPNSGCVGAHFGVVLVRHLLAQVEVATFRSDHFANPAGLVAFIQKNAALWRLRPDQKVVVKGEWETPEERLVAAERVIGQLARIAKAG